MWEGEGPEAEVKDKDIEVEISGHVWSAVLLLCG